MKFPIKTLLVTLVALLLAVPTGALAKGKPSWAGQGNGGGHGKPSWAGQGHSKAEKGKKDKAKAAHEKQAKKEKGNKHQAEAEGEEGEDDPDGLSLEDLQALEDITAPGQYCHALESMQDSLAGMFGGKSFDEHFGENHNDANSFGKCASWRAQGGELSEEEAAEEPAEDSCAPSEEEGTEEEASEEEAAASEEEGTSEEPTGEEPGEGEEGTEDECETEEPAAEEPAEDENGDESEGEESGDESEEQPFTMTVTVEVDLSFLRA